MWAILGGSLYWGKPKKKNQGENFSGRIFSKGRFYSQRFLERLELGFKTLVLISGLHFFTWEKTFPKKARKNI